MDHTKEQGHRASPLTHDQQSAGAPTEDKPKNGQKTMKHRNTMEIFPLEKNLTEPSVSYKKILI